MATLIDVNDLLKYLEEEADKRMISGDELVEKYGIEGLRLNAFCARCGAYALRDIIERVRDKMGEDDTVICLH